MNRFLATIFWLFLAGFISAQINIADTVSVTSASATVDASAENYYQHSGKIMVGLRGSHYNNSFVFRNITANFKGKLYYDYSSKFPDRKIDRWAITPSVFRNFASAFISTKQGSFSFSKSLDVGMKEQTDLRSYQASLTLKNWTLVFDHMTYKGMHVFDPVQNRQLFHRNLFAQPVNVMLEYTGKTPKWMSKLNALKNPLRYTPIKSMSAMSVYFGYSGLTIKDSSDFIPAVQYTDSLNNSDRIETVYGKYLNRFTSHGGFIGVRASTFFVLSRKKVENTYRTLYFKVNLGIHYNIQKYRYYSLTTEFNNSQFKNYQAAVSPSQTLDTEASLIYDIGDWYFSGMASYYYRIYGSSTGSTISQNNVKDQRLTFQLAIGRRISWTGKQNRITRLLF